MITPDNIPSEFMFASTAFPYTKMESLYLKKIDEEEKVILEQEDHQLKDLHEKQKRETTIGAIAGASLAATISYAINADFIFIFSMTLIMPTTGCLIGNEITEKKVKQSTQTTMLRRADRLDEKIREISKKIQVDGKVLEDKEVNELEKAQIFFSNRSLEFKTSKNKSQNTTILSQTNQISMAPQRV